MSDYTTDDSKSKIADRALKCFKRASEAWAKQREREQADLRFQVPEMQWDDTARRQRNGEGATPARPVLSVSEIDQPLDIVIGQMRTANLGVDIHPLGDDGNDDNAEVIQDHYRQIERDSNAIIPRGWAFERAAKCGLGVYRINTRYDEESNHPADQKITIERILDQAAVYFDPDAMEMDFSDAEWAFVTTTVRSSRFKSKWPKAKDPVGDALAFSDAANGSDGWMQEGDNDDPVYRVAEYWWKEYKTESVSWKDDDGADQSRDKEVCTVMWAKLAPGGSPLQFLEGPQEWNGTLIPLVPVIGHELIPFDDERRWVGMIGPAKDAQRVINYGISTAVEIAALEPKAPYIATAKQIEGYEDMWKQANVRNFPVLYYNNQPDVAAPARSQVDASRLGVSMQLVEIGRNGLQSTTKFYDPSLGRTNPKERSGKAIQALQDQSSAATSLYLQNMADISMKCEARIILDLHSTIYDRKGRVVRTLGVEGKSKAVMLNAPHYTHPQTGRPARVPDGETAPQGMKVMNYDLSKGRNGVSVTVGKMYQTRLEQGSAEVSQFMQVLPPELQIAILPTWLKFQDWPGHTELSEIMEKIRDKQMPFLAGNAEDGASDPKQMQAQLQAAQGQLQQMQGELQKAGDMIKTDQVKGGFMLQAKQIDLQIARENNAAKLAAAHMAQKGAAINDAMEAQEEDIALRMNLAADAHQNAADRAHEAGMAAMAAAHGQQAMAQQGAQDASAQAQAGAQDQQAQQADQQHEAGMQASDQQAAAQSQSAQQAHEAEQAAAAQPQEGA